MVQMAVLIKIPVCRDSMLCAVVCACWSQYLTGASHLHNNNNNNIYLLQLGCNPVAVVILHVYKT